MTKHNRTRRARSSSVSALCVACLLASATVKAQELQDQSSDAAVTAAARALAVEGVKLAQSDHCPEAIDKLERAEKLHHAPVVLTRLGECYIQVGRVLAGVESLRAVLREPLPAGASAAVTQAYADAEASLEAAKPRLASLTILVSGAASDAHLNLQIDGHALPAALLGAAQPSDPGPHTITVSAEGYAPATQSVTLASGDAQTVTLTLVAAAPPEPVAATRGEVEAPARVPYVEAESPQAAAQAGSYWPAYISWGVGTVALGLGIGFGIAALNDKAELDRRCPQRDMCSEENAERIDESHSHANISTIGFSVAAGTAALGFFLYWIAKPEQPRDARAERGPRLEPDPRGLTLRF